MIQIARAGAYEVRCAAGRMDDALRFCLRMSTEIFAGKIDGEVACVWGLILPTILSNRPYLWLLTTELVKEHQFLFVRYSQIWIQHVLEEYPAIVGHAEVGQDRSIRWLKWLGAKFGEPQGKLIPFVVEAK